MLEEALALCDLPLPYIKHRKPILCLFYIKAQPQQPTKQQPLFISSVV